MAHEMLQSRAEEETVGIVTSQTNYWVVVIFGQKSLKFSNNINSKQNNNNNNNNNKIIMKVGMEYGLWTMTLDEDRSSIHSIFHFSCSLVNSEF